MSFNPQIIKSKIITRRSFVMTGLKMGALSVLGARLYFLQITEGLKYKDLADGNRIKLVPIIPRRGKILDRYGKIIAEGVPRYQLLYSPPKNSDPLKNFVKIAKLIDLKKEKFDEISSLIKAGKANYPLLIDNFLPWKAIAALKVKSRDLKGVDVRFAESRNYLYPQSTSHLTGYMRVPSEKFVEENKETLGRIVKEADFKVGVSGVESTKQIELIGKPGFVEAEVDSRDRIIREVGYKAYVPGEDVKLTIDLALQNHVHSVLKGKGGIAGEGGSAVVMDVLTGDILAMVSVPDFDANMFTKGISSKDYQAIMNNPDKPMLNKTITAAYPPGSTFKVIAGTAALQEGKISRHDRAFCSGYIEFGGRKFYCWRHALGGHGSVNLEEALKGSCNVFFYEVAKRLGIQHLADYSRKFGLGKKTGVELPSELDGIVPDPAWKIKNLKEPWYEGETLNMGIGQGYLMTTPLQLCVTASRIASGREVNPRLFVDPSQKNITFPFLEGISPQNLQIIQSGMNMVVNGGGTAAASRIATPGMEFAGKTGSSQTRGIERYADGRIKGENLPTHSIFLGYAPVHSPRYAVSVVVEHGGGGSAVAAPVAKQILEFLQNKNVTNA